MKKLLFLFAAIIFCSQLKAQNIKMFQTDSLSKIGDDTTFENIYVKKIADDSLSTSSVIVIKKEVKLHYHANHTENIIIISGEADMVINNLLVSVRKGDMINIPANSLHSVKVTSAKPLKVISIQSPHFDGKDRIYME